MLGRNTSLTYRTGKGNGGCSGGECSSLHIASGKLLAQSVAPENIPKLGVDSFSFFLSPADLVVRALRSLIGFESSLREKGFRNSWRLHQVRHITR